MAKKTLKGKNSCGNVGERADADELAPGVLRNSLVMAAKTANAYYKNRDPKLLTEIRIYLDHAAKIIGRLEELHARGFYKI